MGRPLSKQQLFGANESNNIKVQFHNGTESVKGYILEQTGSKRFRCVDADGNEAVCYLKAKASGDLEEGEMSITVLDDNEDAYQITKIARHRVSYDGVGISAPWTFEADLNDGKVQMEEAGDDDQLTNATDLEGDDGPTIPPGMDRNEPYAGSGGSNSNVPGTFTATSSYVDAFSSSGMTYRNISASALDTVPGTPIDGLYRRKYVGNWSTTYIDEASYEFDVGFMNPANGPISEAAYEVDTYGGFGLRTDLDDENGYAFEWKGYIQAPVTGNYNFFATVDDDCIIWIGSPATATTLGDTTSDYLFAQSGNTRNNATVGVAMTANKWYPIRIWFQEWAGAEKFQLGASNSANSTRYGLGGTNFAFKHNSVTKGY
jgi:hypothetical protein